MKKEATYCRALWRDAWKATGKAVAWRWNLLTAPVLFLAGWLLHRSFRDPGVAQGEVEVFLFYTLSPICIAALLVLLLNVAWFAPRRLWLLERAALDDCRRLVERSRNGLRRAAERLVYEWERAEREWDRHGHTNPDGSRYLVMSLIDARNARFRECLRSYGEEIASAISEEERLYHLKAHERLDEAFVLLDGHRSYVSAAEPVVAELRAWLY